jgi:hypothetical protein
MVRRGIDPQLAEALLAARWALRGSGQAQYLWSFLPQFQQAGVGRGAVEVVDGVGRAGSSLWMGVVARGVSDGGGEEGTDWRGPRRWDKGTRVYVVVVTVVVVGADEMRSARELVRRGGGIRRG